jgi:hypothetical protein
MISPSFRHMGPATRRAARAAFAKGQQAIAYVDLKIAGAPERSLLSDKSCMFLRQVRDTPKLGDGLPMSSRDVRAADGAAMIDALVGKCRADSSLRDGHNRLRLLTIKPDLGLVDIASSSYPAGLVRWSGDRCSRGVVADVLFHLDLALFSPRRGSPETLAGMHVHGAASFAVDSEWIRDDWLDRLAPKTGNENAIGDTIIDISSHGNNRFPVLKPSSAAGLAWYISKETAGVNTIYKSRRGQKSEGNHTDWTYAGALRQLEFWSHIGVLDACWSQGHRGNEMRTIWRRNLLEHLDLCEMPKVTAVDGGKMHDGWVRVWRELGTGFQAIDPDAIKASTLKVLRRVEAKRVISTALGTQL